MASYMSFINRLLPFATPGTPLLQDVLHLATLCVFLYFAPQIQQRVEKWRAPRSAPEVGLEHVALPDDIPADIWVPHEAQELPRDVQDEQDGMANHNNRNGDHEVRDLLAHVNMPIENEAAHADPANMPPTRNVGAKKAKSLARKDQRRAYNEFMRSQGDAQRARDAEGAAEREAVLAAERERRHLVVKDLRLREAREREVRKEKEDADRKEVARRTEFVLSMVRDELDSRRMCDLFRVAEVLGEDADEEWVERVLRTSGMLGKKDDMMMITETGWVVRVTAEDMRAVYDTAIADNAGDANGCISNEELGARLESVLKHSSD